MLNEQFFRDEEGREIRVVGSPIYEMNDFIQSMIRLAAEQHIGVDYDDDEAFGVALDKAWDLRLTKLQLSELAVAAVDELDCTDCIWCGADTSLLGEFYMVHNEVWGSFGPAQGCLCVGCLEDQMGRRLTAGDFTDAPVNRNSGKSDRLRDRMG